MSGHSFERRLLAKVAAVPLGQKLPLSAIARELNSSVSVVTGGIASLVQRAKLDAGTLRPRVEIGLVAPTVRHGMSGIELYDVLMADAERRGVKPADMSVAAFGNQARIYQMRQTARPTDKTIDQALAWMDGNPLVRRAAPTMLAVPASKPTGAEAARPSAPVAEATDAVMVGQAAATVAEVVAREALESVDRKAKARKFGGGVGDPIESPGERFRRLGREVDADMSVEDAMARLVDEEEGRTASDVVRKVCRDLPERWAEIRALAVEIGELPGKMLDQVIAAGIDCMRESMAEDAA